MKTALLSDIHANVRAFEACVRHARAQGVQAFALLGDLVGYGAEPAAVVDMAMDLAAHGAVVLQGNHDAAAVAPPAGAQTLEDSTASWTHAQLDAPRLAFLAGLPLSARLPHAAGDTLLVHASADEPAQWRYVDGPARAGASLDAAADARHVFVGHVHHQTLYYRGAGRGLMAFDPTPGVPVPMPRHRSWLATVGSVGQPRDGRPQAMYAVWDADAAQAVFHRVPYDHLGAAAAIRAAGCPEFFARRLEEGR